MGFFQRRLVKFVVGVVHFPKLTLAICATLLVAGVVFAMTNLQLSTDEDELLTPKLQFFREFKEFSRQFPEDDAFILLLEPINYEHPPVAQRWIEYADRLTAALNAIKPDVVRVDSHVPPETLGAQGMMFDDWDAVREESKHAGDLAKFGRIVGDPDALESIGIKFIAGGSMVQRVLGALGQDKPDESGPIAQEVMRTLAASVKSTRPFSEWTVGVEVPSLARGDPRAAIDPRIRGYNMIPDESKRGTPAYDTEKLLVISVHTAKNYSSMAELTEPLARMRDAVDGVAKDYPDFKPPVITGREAMQADQMRTSDHDTRLAEILGLSLVFIVLLVFLRNLWLVIVAELCLGVGIGWTFGWATLVVGRLNLLSLVFVIALIGIGMDYLIQILTRYRFEKKRYGRPHAVWARVFRFVSPPIFTACCGASAAFFVAMLTDFHGAAELGLIAGGGLLLCLTAGYTVLPALLTIFPASVGRVPEARRYRHREEHPQAGGRRLWPAVVWILVAAAGLYVSLPPSFDPNLIKLQDDDLPSVQEVRKLQSWFAVVTSPDLGKLRAARTAMLEGETSKIVDHTESMLDAYDKRDELLKLNAGLMKVNWKDPEPPTASQLAAVAGTADKLGTQWIKPPAAPTPGKGVLDFSGVKAAAEDLAAALRDKEISEGNKIARAAEWQRRFEHEVRMNVEQFAPPPLDIPALPAPLREHLVSDKATPPVYALYLYPKEDLWEFSSLEPFVKQLEAQMKAYKAASGSDVMLTGIAPQLYHSTEEIRRAFLHSTIFAMIAIVLLVLIDLRNIVQTLLAISVLALGLPMLLLLMYIWRVWLHEPFGILGSWNLANFFALPILIGAGHEYGVFLVHRYRETLQDPKRVWRPWDVSDRALLLCGIVTSASFGFLVFARHHGLQSLGWVMAVGTACTYLAALLVLRPILIWRLKHKKVYHQNKVEQSTKGET